MRMKSVRETERGMDFCLLEDVFPDWTKKQTTDGDMAPAGCGVPPPVAKKKSKKGKGKGKDPALRFLDPSYTLDPDRPFLVKAEVKEAFGGENAPGLRPAYFGASDEDEGFTSVIGTDPSYSVPLTGMAKEAEMMKKSAGEVSLLPDLSLDDMWKPLTEAGVTTANVHALPAPGQGGVHIGYPPSTPQPSYSMPDDLKKRMEQIYSRLEQLEVKTHESSKTEILIFVGSGLFFLVSLNLLTGRS